MKRSLLAIGGLTLLLTAIDQLFRVLHPEVNVARASLVGVTALASLAGLSRLQRGIPVATGALAIFASAFGSVLWIEAGVLVSRSVVSALVHVLILALAWVLLDGFRKGSVGHCAARS